MADLNALVAGLRDYRATLDRQVTLLAAELEQLEGARQALDAVFHGEAAESFRQRWASAANRFHEYLEQGRLVERELERRAAALEIAARQAGG